MSSEKEGLTLEIARQCFLDIQKQCGEFKSELIDNPTHTDLELEFPAQPGLVCGVSLNLQNDDELYFCASAFRCGWFPCTEIEKAEEFKRAVIGFLKGDYRIVEQWRGGRAVKADLQVKDGEPWITVASWSTLHLPFFKKTEKIVQNSKRGLG